jgi:hypothetical protein
MTVTEGDLNPAYISALSALAGTIIGSLPLRSGGARFDTPPLPARLHYEAAEHALTRP